MLNNYITYWKQFFNTKLGFRFLIWKIGETPEITSGKDLAYKAVGYYRMMPKSDRLSKNAKWEYAQYITTTVKDYEMCKDLARSFWFRRCQEAILYPIDVLITVRLVSLKTNEIVEEVSPLIFWGTDVPPKDPRKMPRPTWHDGFGKCVEKYKAGYKW